MMKNKLYLVTGATGFLGNNVCRRLAQKGMRIRALVMEGDPAQKHLPEGVEVIHGDLLDSASLDRFFETDENDEVYVIHCASIVWVKLEENPKVHAVNVEGTANIIDRCVRHRVRKLVYISSTGAIPERPAGEKISEVDHFLPTDGLIGYYSVTKAEATQRVLDAVERHPELDATIIHPSGICGPHDYAFGSVTSMIMQFVQGRMKMGIEGTFNSVDVRDLAEGVIAACEKGRRGECYIMSNDVVTMHDMFQLINDAAGLSGRSYVLSKELARVGVKLLALVSRLTGKEPLLSAFNITMLNRNNDFDCSKAERELGFHCRPFSESIRDTVAWLRQEGYVAMPARAKVVDVRLPALAPSLSRQA
jgi:dihydroflavonol-4-reductase